MLEAAFTEFSRFDFGHASLSRIAADAGIPRGGLYRYFPDKKSLYLYLLDRAAEAKLTYLSENLVSETGDVWEIWRDLFFHEARFNIDNPEKGFLLYNAVRETADPELRAVSHELRDQSRAFFRNMLAKAAARGQIRKDLNLDLAALAVDEVTYELSEHLGKTFGYSGEEAINVRGKEISDDDLGGVVDELVDLFRNGMEPK